MTMTGGAYAIKMAKRNRGLAEWVCGWNTAYLTSYERTKFSTEPVAGGK